MKDLQAPWVGNPPNEKPDRCEGEEQCHACKGKGRLTQQTSDFGKGGRLIRTTTKEVDCWYCDSTGVISEFGDDCGCEFCELQRREHQQDREDYLFDQMKDEGGR